MSGYRILNLSPDAAVSTVATVGPTRLVLRRLRRQPAADGVPIAGAAIVEIGAAVRDHPAPRDAGPRPEDGGAVS